MHHPSPIAIVGLGGVLPGAADLRAFWHNVLNRVDAAQEPPPGRWIAPPAELLDSDIAPDRIYSPRACFVEHVPADAAGLVIDARVLRGLDPLYHLVLRAGRAAFADGATDSLDRLRAGVVLASIALPTDGASAITARVLGDRLERRLMAAAAEAGFNSPRGELFAGRAAGLDPSAAGIDDCLALNSQVVGLPAGLLASALGLGGGSCTLDAACASSLYAIKLACDELQSGRADAMLAGGVSRPDALFTQMGFCQLRALSRRGQCRPFDAAGDGLVVGEGAGVVLLKRLDDALRDGDRVYAVVRGVGWSNDVGGSLLAPDSEGQLRAMTAAYEQAGWSPDDVDYIECHGTGTPTGDAVEVRSLCRLWADAAARGGQCPIGSVKANVGHLLTGAGAAGLIKTILAMQAEVLPPAANFERPAREIPLDGSPFRVPTEAATWTRRGRTTPRRAAVSAFGFGGINAHLLIEEWMPGAVSGGTGVPPVPCRRDARTTQEEKLTEPAGVPDAAPRPIAIVGMAAHFGTLDSLRALQECALRGETAIRPRPVARWGTAADDGDLPAYGAYLDPLQIEVGRFKLPPNEIADVLPQQLLMLQVAASAMEDAGLPLRTARPRMSVLVGMGLDLGSTNFHIRWRMPRQLRAWAAQLGVELSPQEAADWLQRLRDASGPALSATRTVGALGGMIASRIAREFSFGGPSFGLSSEATSGLTALEAGVRALQRGEIDAALVGAVDLAGDERAVACNARLRRFARPRGTGFQPVTRQHINGQDARTTPLSAAAVRSFDDASDGGLPGEGAAAVVIKRLEDALADGDRIYAVIRGIGKSSAAVGSDEAALARAYGRALDRACSEARVAPAAIDYVESHGSGDPREDLAEGRALAARLAGRSEPCALSSVAPTIGQTGAAAGLASLVKASLCVFQEMLPPLPGFESPRPDLGWTDDAVFVPREAEHWLRDRAAGPRRAAVASMGVDGSCAHVILEEHARDARVNAVERVQPLGARSEALFVLRASDAAEVARRAADLEQLAIDAARRRISIERLARDWFAMHFEEPRDRPGRHGALAIVASDPVLLRRSIEQARGLLDNAPSRRLDGRDGAFYSPQPVGSAAPLAFVFPGSGNHFVGMGRGLAAQFPDIWRELDADTEQLAGHLSPRWFSPRRLDYRGDWRRDAAQRIAADPHRMIFGQVAHGVAVSDLLRSFGAEPQAVIGYSLGESAGLFALRAWPGRDEMHRRMEASPLFRRQLGGPCESLRRAWAIAANEPIDWCAAVVARPAAEMRRALKRFGRVRLLIVNTPDECVIGGCRADLRDCLNDIGAAGVFLPGVPTVHCDAAAPVEAAYRELHLMRTTPPANVRFYSAAWARAYDVTRERAAASITEQALHGFDFAALIRQAHRDGVRIFVEVGPGASCTRMIEKILEGKPFVARSAGGRGENEFGEVLRLLAALAAEGVAVDLTPLYSAQTRCIGHRVESAAVVQPAVVTAPLSGPAFESLPLPARRQVGAEEPALVVAGAAPAPYDAASDDWTSARASGRSADRVEVPHSRAAEFGAGQVAPAQLETVEALRIDSPVHAAADGWSAPAEAVATSWNATSAAHAGYLAFAEAAGTGLASALRFQNELAEALLAGGGAPPPHQATEAARSYSTGRRPMLPGTAPDWDDSPPRSFTRPQCMEFARGSIARVLGPRFATVDAHPTRVRLPDEPLMLVDRILSVEGAPCSLGGGRIVTEHDVLAGDWYLDGGRMPVSITVESGQADLFLSAFLGIDLATRGLRMYRLLDATVTFHRRLPLPGEVVCYDIRIDRFVRQGDTYLFFFEFDGTIDGRPMLTMREGCAGFFTYDEIEQSGGIVLSAEDARLNAGKRPEWNWLFSPSGNGLPAQLWHRLPAGDLQGGGHPHRLEAGATNELEAGGTTESYDDRQIEALRRGELAGCFGPTFAGLPLRDPVRLPGGRMKLIDRVPELDLAGGRFGLGSVRAEADVHPDDWYLTCHFVDDKVMPGTLMYECCGHALRVLLMRMGWVVEQDETCFEPLIGVPARLRCRGPVTERTKKVVYEVEIKEIGASPDLYVIADALMYADGRRIVQFRDMSMRMTGVTRDRVEAIWRGRESDAPSPLKGEGRGEGDAAAEGSAGAEPQFAGPASLPVHAGTQARTAALAGSAVRTDPPRPIGDHAVPDGRASPIFDTDRILAFAVGDPSTAFGEPYRVFDRERRIARLPGPPFQFLDRITRIEHCRAFELAAGGWIEAQYDVAPDAWYFAANRQAAMPFSVILEAALQPCGWLAAYLGSALRSPVDLSFRNLGGTATLHEELFADAGTLTTRVRMTSVSEAGGMIIQNYDFQMWRRGRVVYDGTTMFGFFTAAALAQQVGIRDAAARAHQPSAANISRARRIVLPDDPPRTPGDAARCRMTPSPLKGEGWGEGDCPAALPARAYRMIDEIEAYVPDGGPAGQGYARAATDVRPADWFFKAHFHQDPVWPGSLGLESFLQVLKIMARERFGERVAATHRFESIAVGASHTWLYRGQIIPTNRRVSVTAAVTGVEDGEAPLIHADGFLSVDGITIYEMKDFATRMTMAGARRRP